MKAVYMIDTFMAFWNQNSHNRGVRVFFTSSLVCLSLSLLLVTIVIPGWILFTQNNANPAPVSVKNIALPTSLTGGVGGVTATAQVPVANNNSNTAAVLCATPTPHSGPARSARVQEALGVQSPAHVPLLPTSVALPHRASAFTQSHTIYSGRPGGSMTHLQVSSHKESSPTPLATTSVFSKATVGPSLPDKKTTPTILLPHIRLNGAHQKGNALFARVPHDDSKILETNSTLAAGSSLSVTASQLRQKNSDKCASASRPAVGKLSVAPGRHLGMFAGSVICLALVGFVMSFGERRRSFC